MSVERKIKELLNRKSDTQLNEEEAPMQGSSQKASFETISMQDSKPTVSNSKDNSKAGSVPTAGDTTQPKQGNSKDADIEELGAAENGKNASAKASKESTIKPKDDGDQMPNMQGDSKKATYTEDVEKQIQSIFGDDLSEEFKSKATSIFEAAVIARVNSEMETVVAKLEEQNAEQLVEYKEALVEKIDGYLNYVVEQWMEENQVAIDSSLNAQIAEEFMQKLKALFEDSYIQVPEEKLDVVEELTAKLEELEEKLNGVVSENIELRSVVEAKNQEEIFDEVSEGLALSQVEKFRTLAEGVDYDSAETYRKKLEIVKEQYFSEKKATAKTIEEQEMVELDEEVTPQAKAPAGPVSNYVSAIARTIKK